MADLAKIISVISGKGGTGKSTISALLSQALASVGSAVLAVDLDMGLRSLDLLLGLENKVIFDIGDILAGKCAPEHALVSSEAVPGLKLLCAPLSLDKSFEPAAVAAILRQLAEGFDYLVVDTPAGLNLSVFMTKEIADLALVVTVPDIVTIRDTRKIVDILMEEERKPCRLIINKVSRGRMTAGNIQDLDQIIDTAGIPLFGVIPMDEYINSGLSNGKGRQSAVIGKIFEAMAHRVIGQYVPIVLKKV